MSPVRIRRKDSHDVEIDVERCSPSPVLEAVGASWKKTLDGEQRYYTSDVWEEVPVVPTDVTSAWVVLTLYPRHLSYCVASSPPSTVPSISLPPGFEWRQDTAYIFPEEMKGVYTESKFVTKESLSKLQQTVLRIVKTP